MKLVTWNVNGIRARLDRVLPWIAEKQPDVLCLQEIKIESDKFPADPFRALGYEVHAHGQKTWNGVAILSKLPLSGVEMGMCDGADDPQCRLVSGVTPDGTRVVNVYCPNGEAPGSDKYAYKLAWYARLRTWVAARLGEGARLAVLGDFNVAPADLDVHDPAAWHEQILCSTPEREALAALAGLGLVDVVRKLHPTDVVYTWWDYRMLGFPKNRGLRIDHVLATPAVADRARAAWVDREARKGQQPSDHAPVIVELE
jgi:exodeoxyribonuclease-3